MRLTRALKAITPIASAYGFEFDGVTRKGHYRWVHPSGAVVISISEMTSRRGIKNTERDMKRAVEIANGQHRHAH